MTQEQKMLRNCTFVKSILMILVVAGHSLDFWTGEWFTRNPAIMSNFCDLLSKWLNSFHTYSFVLVSGYLFRYLKYERNNNNRDYEYLTPFVYKKALRLLVPYAFVSLIWIIPISIYFFHYGLKDIVIKFVMASAPGQLWFLWMLFDVFIGFFILSGFFDKRTFLGVILVIAIYFIEMYGIKHIPNAFQIWKAAQYLPLFWIGFEIRKWRLPLAKIEIAMGLFFVYNILFTVIYVMTLVQKGMLLYHACALLLHTSGALMAFSTLEIIGEKVHWQDSKQFMMLADNSMIIYLFHQQVIYFVIVWLNGIVSPEINALANFTVSLGVSLIIAIILRKWKVTRFLVGEKM